MPFSSLSWGELAYTGFGGALGVGASLVAGVGAAPLVGLGLAGLAVGRYVGSRRRVATDRFRSVVISPDESPEDIKRDVDRAMGKIKDLIARSGVDRNLSKKGRDHWFYAPLKELKGLVRNWNTTWTVDQTAGLLLDLQSALRDTPLQGSSQDRSGLSGEQQTIREKGYGATPFGNEMRSLGDTQANPSATTACLLTFLRTTQHETHITALEIEAIMQAVVMFWEGRAKRYTGEFHTPLEVWMAYAQHLEKAT